MNNTITAIAALSLVIFLGACGDKEECDTAETDSADCVSENDTNDTDDSSDDEPTE